MIIETKFHIPKTKAHLVDRNHLYERLHGGLNLKLTLVTAPAGYGKSTLLSEWTKSLKVKIAWVALDRNDNHPIRFWKHVIESLKQSSTLFARQVDLHYFGEDQDATGNTLVAKLMNRLNRTQEKIVLILDDFHHVDDHLILEGITYFLKHLPNSLHICISSRVHPPLPLSRLRVEGNLNDLSVDDIRFTLDESAIFLNEYIDLPMNTEGLKSIYMQTEGWIAGIRLVALSLKNEEDFNQFVATNKKLGKHRNITDYFFEEVLLKQSVEIQQFLLKTSILERMNEEIVKSITNIVNGRQLLQQLEQENLFLISLDNRQEWYRYHHLFQDFLQIQLTIQFPELVKSLHYRAGHWFLQNDFVPEAIDHYIQGEYFAEALQLLELHAEKLMQINLDRLLNWLQLIPDYLLLKKQNLLFINISSLLLSGQIELADKKRDWTRRVLQENQLHFSKEMVQSYESGLSQLEIIRSYFTGDFEETVRLTELFIETYPEGGTHIHLGNDGDGYHPRWDFAATMGGPREAEKILNKLYQLWSKTDNVFFLADVCLANGMLMYAWDRLEEAKFYLEQAYNIQLRHGNANFYTLAAFLLAKTYTALGDVQQSEQIMEHIKLEINPNSYPNLSKKVEFFHAQLAFYQGKINQANKWIKRADIYPGDNIPPFVTEEYELLAHLLVVLGKNEEGKLLIKKLLYKAQQENRIPLQIEMLLLQSLLYQSEDILQSFHILEQALIIIKENGYIRTIIDQGHQMGNLLEQYIKLRQYGQYTSDNKVSVLYVKQLVQFMKSRDEELPINQIEDIHLLTEKEKLVLKHIQLGLSNKEIAKQLNISLSTVKTHINNLYNKLEVTNRVLAIQKAQKLKIL